MKRSSKVVAFCLAILATSYFVGFYIFSDRFIAYVGSSPVYESKTQPGTPAFEASFKTSVWYPRLPRFLWNVGDTFWAPLYKIDEFFRPDHWKIIYRIDEEGTHFLNSDRTEIYMSGTIFTLK